MPLTFHIGDKPVITTTFTDVDGVAASPTVVEAFTQSPDGVETPLTPVEADPGVFTTTVQTLDQPGMWYWRVAGTAGIIAADEGHFHVRRSVF